MALQERTPRRRPFHESPDRRIIHISPSLCNFTPQRLQMAVDEIGSAWPSRRAESQDENSPCRRGG